MMSCRLNGRMKTTLLAAFMWQSWNWTPRLCFWIVYLNLIHCLQKACTYCLILQAEVDFSPPWSVRGMKMQFGNFFHKCWLLLISWTVDTPASTWEISLKKKSPVSDCESLNLRRWVAECRDRPVSCNMRSDECRLKSEDLLSGLWMICMRLSLTLLTR